MDSRIKQREFGGTPALWIALGAGKIGAWELKLPSRILTASTQCKANYGRGPDAPFTYDDLHDSICPDYRSLLNEAVQAAIQTSGPFSLEYQCKWPDGTIHWIAVNGIAIPGEGADPGMLAGITQEISDRKRVETELRAAEDILEARIKERTSELSREVVERQKAETELRELSRKLMTLKEEQQRSIARELHDSVGQYIAAASMSLGVIEANADLPAAVRKTLSGAIDSVQEASKEVRLVAYLLHPPMLDEMGLASAIGFYLDGFSERSGITTEVSVTDDFGRLSIELETALFRACQECLTNIHRHSGSPVARILLSRFPRLVRLQVEDKGRGMPNRKFSGVGLRGLRERIAQFSGTTTVVSGTNGTTVTIEVPL